MGTLWVVIGVSAIGTGLGLWISVRAITRRHAGVGFGIAGGPLLILAAAALLGGYVSQILLPSMAVDAAVFIRPAPVDGNATVFYLSHVVESNTNEPTTTTNTLIALTARTGAIRWQRVLPQATAPGELAYAVDGDSAYVATPAYNGITVTAYRGADGVSPWQTTMSMGFPMAVAVNGGAVYILSSREQQQPSGSTEPVPPLDAINALNVSDGSQRWSGVTSEGHFGASALIVAPDTVYLVTLTGVRAYRASDGTLLWTRAQIFRNTLRDVPVAMGDALYLPGSGNNFSAVRASDGATVCVVRDAAGSNEPEGLLAVSGDTVYIAAPQRGSFTDGQGRRVVNPATVYAYDAATCAPRWRYTTASSNAARTLIAGDDAVYVNADDGIHALRATDGTVRWHRDAVNVYLQGAGWAFVTQPDVLGDTLFVTSPLLFPSIGLGPNNGRVHVFAIGADGSDDWHTPVSQVFAYHSHFFS